MNEKITITIDVSKITKSKIVSRTYLNKANEEVTVKELKLDIVPVKEPTLLKDGDTYQLFRTHFIAELQTKEERDAKVKSKILGNGTMFKNKEVKKVEPEDIMPGSEEISDSDSIPF